MRSDLQQLHLFVSHIDEAIKWRQKLVQNYFEVKLFSKIVNLKQNLQVIIEQVVGSNNALNQCYTFVQWHPLNIFTEHLDKILLIISKSLLYY